PLREVSPISPEGEAQLIGQDFLPGRRLLERRGQHAVRTRHALSYVRDRGVDEPAQNDGARGRVRSLRGAREHQTRLSERALGETTRVEQTSERVVRRCREGWARKVRGWRRRR